MGRRRLNSTGWNEAERFLGPFGDPDTGRLRSKPDRDRWDPDHPFNRPVRPFGDVSVWPIWIPETTPERFVSRFSTLNLPSDRPGGDWHSNGIWFSDKVAARDGTRLTVEMTPVGNGSTVGILGAEGVGDIRSRLAWIGHPAADQGKPVWGADYARSAIDVVWAIFKESGGAPEPRYVQDWLFDDDLIRAQRMALALGRDLTDPGQRSAWMSLANGIVQDRSGYLDYLECGSLMGPSRPSARPRSDPSEVPLGAVPATAVPEPEAPASG